MPELPEVETVRRSLLPLIGVRIDRVDVHERRLRKPIPEDLDAGVAGATFSDFERRAKYLLCHLDRGISLLVHLGMSGVFHVRPTGSPRRRHDHVVFRLAGRRELVFHDPRRFGLLQLGRPQDFSELRGLGIDPLSEPFTAAALWALTRGRSKPIKNLLMDQAHIVGVGNIYANEALFRAGVRPRRAAQHLRRAEVERIHHSVGAVLREAIELGGSSIADYRDGRGEPGYFQLRLAVYDREGAPCPNCAALIRRTVLAGRSTFFCDRCQR